VPALATDLAAAVMSGVITLWQAEEVMSGAKFLDAACDCDTFYVRPGMKAEEAVSIPANAGFFYRAIGKVLARSARAFAASVCGNLVIDLNEIDSVVFDHD